MKYESFTIFRILNARILKLSVGFLLLASCKEQAGSANGQRIITLGGSITEIVYALNQGSKLVATDITSVFPEEAQKLPRLGYFRNIPVEGIIGLKPDLLLASSEAGPPAAIEKVRSLGTRVETIPEAFTPAAAKERLKKLGVLLGRSEQADELINKMENDLKQAEKNRAAPGKDVRKALFLYARGSGLLLAAGEETGAATMFELAGLRNAMQGFKGMKPTSAEAIVLADPDLIVMLQEAVQSLGGKEKALSLPGVAQTRAGKENRLIVMDDLLFSGFTHRLGEAVLALQQAAGTLL
ncbi:MAG: ABC transporter substrate-binding protein [Spirochaetales bacterium]|nr:ABC transporter substrate-binding protein [Spirochaetales bacterium]